MTGISDGFTMLTSALNDTLFFNVSWIISLVFVFFTMLLITRDFQKWKLLALPVTIMWHIVGIRPSILFYIGASIIFAVEAFSLQTLGEVIGTISRTASSLVSTEGAKRKAEKMRKELLGPLERENRFRRAKEMSDEQLLDMLKFNRGKR